VRIPLPNELYEAELIIMSNDQCKGFFPPPVPGSGRSYYIYDDMVCAADYDMSKSICAVSATCSLGRLKQACHLCFLFVFVCLFVCLVLVF
jgi:hypothetical protein